MAEKRRTSFMDVPLLLMLLIGKVMNISNANGKVLTETRVVGAIIQPILPAQVQPDKYEEKIPAMIKQNIVKQIDTKSQPKTITMTLSELPKYSNYVQKCKVFFMLLVLRTTALHRGAFYQFSFPVDLLLPVVVNQPERKLTKRTSVHWVHSLYIIHLSFQGNQITRHLQNVTNVDKPNPYVRWADRWEPIPEAWQPQSTSGRNCSVRQPLLVYNKVPRVF